MFLSKKIAANLIAQPQPIGTDLIFLKKYVIIYIERIKEEHIYV